ncbi:MAG: hypothetical protein KME45_19775 [Stenomitos rutilans HA7619-LM2]|jgi:hypothetical protein|nr:hypothetical protein [Stenomitos rutilans HA7619-LM2]
MNCPRNLAEVVTALVEKVNLSAPKNKHERDQRERLLNELMTAYYRYILPGLGWKRADYAARLTAAEKLAADAFAATLPVKVLLQFPEALEKGFNLADAPQSSRSTYGARLRSVLTLIETETWFPGNAVLNRRSPDECRPKMRQGRGDWREFSLMDEKGKQLKYRIQAKDMSPTLQQQLEALGFFMSDPDNLDRSFDELEASTASGYDSGIHLWLGWDLYHDNPALNPHDLTLEHLIPKITQDDLEGLSVKDCKTVWKKAQRELEARVNRYFEFLRTKQKADSPRTRLLKLAALLMLAKFLYASEVEQKEDYKVIPIIRTLLKLMDKEQKAVKVWEKDRRYVANQARKWPEPLAGQTVLEYVQSQLIEILRLECRPRHSTGDFCKGHTIAKSHLLYLLFVDVGLLPPGRQQEPRTYRIALSCPLERPETVPLDGLYWPLPPDWSREKRRRDGSLADNYLYKVYHYDGQFYDQGVWVREKCKYKTHRYHGKRAGVIDNIVFEDGHCLYDYIERYLCGQWYVGHFREGQRYAWWDAKLRGSYGRWLSQGRAAFASEHTPVVIQEGKSEVWVSSYLFLNPRSGAPLTDVQMSELFARNSYRILGKRITPHTFRYMWATWAFQMELSYAELGSLAHGMGFTVKTMQQMYERVSLTEKNRPINKAMRKLFPWFSEQTPSPAQGDRLSRVKDNLSQLSAEELQELRKFLGDDPAA